MCLIEWKLMLLSAAKKLPFHAPVSSAHLGFSSHSRWVYSTSTCGDPTLWHRQTETREEALRKRRKAGGGSSLLVFVTFPCQPAVRVSLEARAQHRSQAVSQTHTYTVAERSGAVLCPQYQMAVVSRGRATELDPGQVISEYFIEQRGRSAASETSAASVITNGF